jgi:hypothetical protein
MRNYFVPIPLMVLVNFAALAAVVLQVFALQVFVHFSSSDVESLTAVRIYIGIYAITYIALTLLVAVDMMALRFELSLAVRRKGVRQLIGYETIAISLMIWASVGWSPTDSYTVTVGSVGYRTFGIEGSGL